MTESRKRKTSYLHDEDGPSFGRMMIVLSILIMLAGIYGHDEECVDLGKYLFTTFMGWEARKRVGNANQTFRSTYDGAVPEQGAPVETNKSTVLPSRPGRSDGGDDGRVLDNRAG